MAVVHQGHGSVSSCLVKTSKMAADSTLAVGNTPGMPGDGVTSDSTDNTLGIHNLHPVKEKESILHILNRAPQQVRKRQLNQHRDLLSNLYNLGFGAFTASFDEAAEAMLERSYPGIFNDKQDEAISSPRYSAHVLQWL